MGKAEGKKERGIRVLVIDDEPDFRQLMKFWLELKGYVVVLAEDGLKGLEVVKKEPPDIIFLDLRMPSMDGVEVLKAIRKINKDLPVVIISAYLEDQKLKETMNYGVSGVFCKGKGFTEGLALLETALRTHKKLKK